MRSMLLYAGYQIRLRSGWLRLRTPAGGRNLADAGAEPKAILRPASQKDLQRLLGKQSKEILEEAELILQGQVRLFGAEPRKLVLTPAERPRHWTQYHDRLPNGGDIKPVW
jgi:hypothetical protein